MCIKVELEAYNIVIFISRLSQILIVALYFTKNGVLEFVWSGYNTGTYQIPSSQSFLGRCRYFQVRMPTEKILMRLFLMHL
jgi:hypothetical protein